MAEALIEVAAEYDSLVDKTQRLSPASLAVGSQFR
jgi:hypothetical protein